MFFTYIYYIPVLVKHTLFEFCDNISTSWWFDYRYNLLISLWKQILLAYRKLVFYSIYSHQVHAELKHVYLLSCERRTICELPEDFIVMTAKTNIKCTVENIFAKIHVEIHILVSSFPVIRSLVLEHICAWQSSGINIYSFSTMSSVAQRDYQPTSFIIKTNQGDEKTLLIYQQWYNNQSDTVFKIC